MPGSSALQLYPYPTSTDSASPAGIQTLAQAVEKQVVAVFADAATRDSRWTAATGIGNGAMCFLLSTGELQLRSSGAWIVIGGRASSYAMQSGAFNVTTATATISGPSSPTWTTGRFSQAPQTFLQVTGTSGSLGAGSSGRVANISVTGADFYIVSGTSSAAGTAITCHYLAIQMTSAAANG